MSHPLTFDLLYTALCHLIIKYLGLQKIFQKKKKKGMRRNIVQPPSRTDTCAIKWINKYLLFRPHLSLEYNYISGSSEVNKT